MKPFSLMLILLMSCLILQAQKKPVRQKSVVIGWHQRVENPNAVYPDNQLPVWQTNFKLPTIGFERTIGKWGTFQIGGGANLFGPHKNQDFSKFNTQFYSELRYFFMLRHNRPANGFYFGLYADVNRMRWKYRDSKKLAVRTSWEDAGPSFGYQHSMGLGRHFLFNEGVVAVIQSSVRTFSYDPSGQVNRFEQVVDAWYSFYWYAKIAYVF